MRKMIELKNITFGYDADSPVLKNYSLTINSGEFITILGHNGSGKSTLSKLLVGLMEPQQGEIIIDGELLSEDTIPTIRQKIGIVFQNPDNQFVGSTVRDDIAFGLENKCVSYDVMNELVERYAQKVGMEKFLDSEPHYLSGGEKQRVAIAGVLALGANIIILDEATAMLDPRGRREGVTSDPIIVMNEGEIILEGVPKEVFQEKELLESVKLDVPFAVKASYELKQRGLLKEVVTNDEELMDELCKLHSNR